MAPPQPWCDHIPQGACWSWSSTPAWGMRQLTWDNMRRAMHRYIMRHDCMEAGCHARDTGCHAVCLGKQQDPVQCWVGEPALQAMGKSPKRPGPRAKPRHGKGRQGRKGWHQALVRVHVHGAQVARDETQRSQVIILVGSALGTSRVSTSRVRSPYEQGEGPIRAG